MHRRRWPTAQLSKGCLGLLYIYLRFCHQALVGRGCEALWISLTTTINIMNRYAAG